MVRIGITGGIGSGKSTVCEVWKSMGAYIINADEVAKRLMVENESVKQAIIETFGTPSYHPDGSLNRTFLADQAFAKSRVKELNNIVHPRIPAEVDRLMNQAMKNGAEALIYEAALLLQNLRPKSLDYIVIVLADKNRRIDWVKERDNVSEKPVTDRINKQQDFEQLTDQSDITIHNNRDLKSLKAKAKKVYQKLTGAKED